jgi:hypothetical protein
MATNRSTCHPGDCIEALNRLPVCKIDLERELQQLSKETPGSGKLGEAPKPREISGLPNRSDSDEGRDTNPPAQSRGKGSIQLLKGQVSIHLADHKVNMWFGANQSFPPPSNPCRACRRS